MNRELKAVLGATVLKARLIPFRPSAPGQELLATQHAILCKRAGTPYDANNIEYFINGDPCSALSHPVVERLNVYFAELTPEKLAILDRARGK